MKPICHRIWALVPDKEETLRFTGIDGRVKCVVCGADATQEIITPGLLYWEDRCDAHGIATQTEWETRLLTLGFIPHPTVAGVAWIDCV